VIRKLATLLGCLLSLGVFGGIGAGASWVMGTSLRDAHRARDCVKVRAEVVSADVSLANAKPSEAGRGPGLYRYKIGEQEYTGSRLGTMTVAGADPFDDWQDTMRDFLQSAATEKRPVTVCVDPDNPAISVVDREIRWGMLSLIAPFAFVFSLMGIASLYGFLRALFAPLAPFARKPKDAHPAGMWIFAIIWNVVSFPIAGAAIPDFVRDGDWEAWFILLFPLFGVLIAWGAFNLAIKYHTNRYRQAPP
jgi:Protein of unknown function (DUF3592)